MARAYLATVWLIVVSAAAPIPIMILEPALRPNFLGYSLAMVAMVATAFKILLSDLLSSEGFNVEKTACDMALALFAALTSLAVVQQFRDEIVVPIASLATSRDPSAVLTEARMAMWKVAGGTGALFLLSVTLVREARTLDAEVPLQRLARAGCRIFAVVSGTICYIIYFLVVLLRTET